MKKENMRKTCYNKKLEDGRACYSTIVRHNKCGHVGCNTKATCPSSVMTKTGHCSGCGGPIYIGDLKDV